MSNLEKTTAELLAKFDNILTQYTPAVIDAAEGAIQVSAISNLVGGVLIAFLTYFTIKSILSDLKKAENPDIFDWATQPFLFFMVKGVIAAIGAPLAFFTLIEVWHWISLFNPHLGLAHKILGL